MIEGEEREERGRRERREREKRDITYWRARSEARGMENNTGVAGTDKGLERTRPRSLMI